MPTILFTRENAGEMARKANAVRREKKRLKELSAQASPSKPLSERLALIDEQIMLTRDVLNKEQMPAHHRASLLRALDGLLERERVLRQIPGPGRLKASNPDQFRRRIMPEPIPIPIPMAQVST